MENKFATRHPFVRVLSRHAACSGYNGRFGGSREAEMVVCRWRGRRESGTHHSRMAEKVLVQTAGNKWQRQAARPRLCGVEQERQRDERRGTNNGAKCRE